jgi:hypothetical protein
MDRAARMPSIPSKREKFQTRLRTNLMERIEVVRKWQSMSVQTFTANAMIHYIAYLESKYEDSFPSEPPPNFVEPDETITP